MDMACETSIQYDKDILLFFKQAFRAYFLSGEAFVAKLEGKVVGTFYVKPNFPGRCSHICNGGFIVDESVRGNGLNLNHC